MKQLLQALDLSESEIKVYEALLHLGRAKKREIVARSGISPSKLYDVADKLIDRGLLSFYKENGVTIFVAAPPQRIQALIKEKEQEVKRLQQELKEQLPTLTTIYKEQTAPVDVEVFRGWAGLTTAYEDILNTLKKGDTDLVFGVPAGGSTPKRARAFYDKFTAQTARKGIKLKIIFNSDAKPYLSTSKAETSHCEYKFLDQKTPTEINVYKDKTLIVTTDNPPLAVLIKSKKAADSFREHFKVLWKQAKE